MSGFFLHLRGVCTSDLPVARLTYRWTIRLTQTRLCMLLYWESSLPGVLCAGAAGFLEEAAFENLTTLTPSHLKRGLERGLFWKRRAIPVADQVEGDGEGESQPEGNVHLPGCSLVFFVYGVGGNLLLFGVNPPSLSHIKTIPIKTPLAQRGLLLFSVIWAFENRRPGMGPSSAT